MASLLRRAGRHWIPLLIVGGFFVASRAAAYAAGVRFDSSPLGQFLQLVDPELLRTRLVESLFYLHSQPPLFNLFLGVLLKATASHYAAVAQIAYLVLGLAGSFALYGVLVRTRCSIRTSTAVAVLITVAPVTILYEHWLFYEHPVAVLLVLSAFALAEFMRGQSFRSGFLFFSSMAAVIWMRSTFQLVWMLLAVGLTLIALRNRRKVVLQACLLPLLLVVALYAKNLALFGTPSTSSWLGMSLAEKLFTSVPLADRADRVSRGELSRVSLVRPFAELDAYRGRVSLSQPTGIPVLDEPRLPFGTANLNNKSYLRISELYLGDSLRLIRDEPTAYLRSIVTAVKLAFQPPSDQRRTIGTGIFRSYYKGFNRVVYVQTPYAARVGLAILAAYALALLYGLRLLHLWVDPARRSDPALVTLLYAWLTVVYMTGVLAFVSLLEASRIRFEVDSLVAVLVACAGTEAWLAVRRGSSAPNSGGVEVDIGA